MDYATIQNYYLWPPDVPRVCRKFQAVIGGEVVAAVDINDVANAVYSHNFPQTKLLQKNVQSLTSADINAMSPDALLMSPPCQPFTRVGLKKDTADNRCHALLHIIDLLPKLCTVRYLLLENVKGFEGSEARDQLLTALRKADYKWQEMVVSPNEAGMPNVRHRYYLLAKRRPLVLNFATQEDIMHYFPDDIDYSCSDNSASPTTIADILDEADDGDSQVHRELELPDRVLKRAPILDIVTAESTKSCCFTKAYASYVEGTGSVYCPRPRKQLAEAFTRSGHFELNSESHLACLRALGLRYFTPSEVARLMSFPATKFSFPPTTTDKQKYRLLGNSVNVRVVALLIRLLVRGDQ